MGSAPVDWMTMDQAGRVAEIVAPTLDAMGYDLVRVQLDGNRNVTLQIMADRKDEVDDRDLQAILSEQAQVQVKEQWQLDLVQVSAGDHSAPTATVRLIDRDGAEHQDAAIGTGPVDAIYQAINRVVDIENELTEFSVKSVTEGIDAVGEVTIRIEAEGRTYTGRAADTDILVASARAYLHALNRLTNVAAPQQPVTAAP